MINYFLGYFFNKIFRNWSAFCQLCSRSCQKMRADRQTKGTHWLGRFSNVVRRLFAFLSDSNSYRRRIYARVECRSVFADL